MLWSYFLRPFLSGVSDLILDLFGPEVGAHARSAVSMAELPFDFPVEIEGEVEISPSWTRSEPAG